MLLIMVGEKEDETALAADVAESSSIHHSMILGLGLSSLYFIPPGNVFQHVLNIGRERDFC